MHIDLDPDNAQRYYDASQKSGRSARKIINAILRTVETVDITEIVEVKLKKDEEMPRKQSRPIIVRKQSHWRVTV